MQDQPHLANDVRRIESRKNLQDTDDILNNEKVFELGPEPMIETPQVVRDESLSVDEQNKQIEHQM